MIAVTVDYLPEDAWSRSMRGLCGTGILEDKVLPAGKISPNRNLEQPMETLPGVDQRSLLVILTLEIKPTPVGTGRNQVH